MYAQKSLKTKGSRYEEVPLRTKPEDIARCEKVIGEIEGLCQSINELKLRIKGRKDDLPVEGGKIWEQKELITIKKSLELIEEHQQIADEYANNLKYVFSQIKPQFIAMQWRIYCNAHNAVRTH